jgi:hypothetical protein
LSTRENTAGDDGGVIRRAATFILGEAARAPRELYTRTPSPDEAATLGPVASAKAKAAAPPPGGARGKGATILVTQWLDEMERRMRRLRTVLDMAAERERVRREGKREVNEEKEREERERERKVFCSSLRDGYVLCQ